MKLDLTRNDVLGKKSMYTERKYFMPFGDRMGSMDKIGINFQYQVTMKKKTILMIMAKTGRSL
jgi:hypothetical protein